ncbi:gas vesicle protein GvpO [Streptomyces sp. NPDC012466]|uniref:gas vesicle protein GvpO n=1 Tax=Streptomyces sp. NPDC012466 TaxID=3364835 RepID=UPI0036EF206F
MRGAGEAARRAAEALTELVSHRLEGVSAVCRGEDDDWIVDVDVLELARISPARDTRTPDGTGKSTTPGPARPHLPANVLPPHGVSAWRPCGSPAATPCSCW